MSTALRDEIIAPCCWPEISHDLHQLSRLRLALEMSRPAQRRRRGEGMEQGHRDMDAIIDQFSPSYAGSSDEATDPSADWAATVAALVER